jgi:hypothetical protein
MVIAMADKSQFGNMRSFVNKQKGVASEDDFKSNTQPVVQNSDFQRVNSAGSVNRGSVQTQTANGDPDRQAKILALRRFMPMIYR